MTERFIFRAPEGPPPQRLDKFLAEQAALGVSRARAQRLIAAGHVRLEGAVCLDAAAKIRAGQQVEAELPPATPLALEAVEIPLEILYEDAHLIVLNKPPGLTVHPAPGEKGPTLVHALLHHCGESLSGIGGVQRPGIVHRLDKDTSGAMLAAKTDAAHHSLAAQLKDRSLSRLYHAVAYGLPRPAAGTIEGNIGRNPQNRKKMAVLEQSGKPARTHYRTLEVFPPAYPLSGQDPAATAKASVPTPALSLLECKLETGRTHQIRVHLAHCGHPLLGDPLYGRLRRLADPEIASIAASFSRQALHAAEIAFRHPASGETLRFRAEYPSDFSGLLSSLRTCKTGKSGL